MTIYIVSGRALLGQYKDAVDVFEDMEEKQKTYVGYGKRIEKEKIGRLEQSKIIGSYQIVLIDKNEIPTARRQIRDAVLSYNRRKYEEYKADLESTETYDLNSEIEFR